MAQMKRVFLTAGVAGFTTLFAAAVLEMDTKACIFFFLGICLVLLACAAIAVALKHKVYKFFLIVLCSVVLCGGSWCIKQYQYQKDQQQLTQEPISLTVMLEDDGYQSANGYYIYTASATDQTFSHKIKFITDQKLQCNTYDYVSATFTFSKPEDEYALSNLSDSVAASAFVPYEQLKITQNPHRPLRSIFSDIRTSIADKIDQAMPEYSGTVKALLLGDRRDMQTEDQQALQTAGLAHIVAVSGAHVSIFLAFLGVILQFIKNEKIKYTTFILLAFLIMGICGFTPSVVRAAIMAIVSYLALMAQRRSDSLNNLGLVVFLMLIINPFLAGSVSFILSVCATLGILLFSNRLYHAIVTQIFLRFSAFTTGFARICIQAFCVTLPAMIFTLPAMIWAFGGVSFIGILSNIICMPIIQITFPLCIIATIIAFILPIPGIVWIVGRVAEYGIYVFLQVVHLFANVPVTQVSFNPYVVLIAVTIGIVSYFILNFPKQYSLYKSRKKTNIILPIVLSACLLITGIAFDLIRNAATQEPILTDEECMINFIDVGQGKCTAVIRGTTAAVFDCGGEDAGEKAQQALTQSGVDEIEFILLSHLHEDHTNGVADLCAAFDVNEIIIPYTAQEEALYPQIVQLAENEGAQLTTITEDTLIDFYGVSAQLLTHHLYPQAEDANDNSLVCLVRYQKFSVLLTGDITQQAERRLLLSYSTSELTTTVLDVAHHGSGASSSDSFIEIVHPKVSIVSVGKDNTYGHPSEQVITKLNQYGSVFRTDQMGNIIIITNGSTAEVKTAA